MMRLALAMVVAFALMPAGARAAEPPFSDGDYWAFADRVMGGLVWSETKGSYLSIPGQTVRVNSAVLLTHSVAALTGHTGTARQDERARRIVDRLTRAPAWLGTAGMPADGLATCWSADLDAVHREHPSLEPRVAEALTWAWRARAALALSDAAVARIGETVGACAGSVAWRFPWRVANQVNWNADLYASAAMVAGRTDLLARDYGFHLAAFTAGIAQPTAGLRSTNLGGGYQFHYVPGHRAGAGRNLDAPEYANAVVTAVGHYENALRAGMVPLPDASVRRVRAWITRLLSGSWTHAGYLNWDTGNGLRRWHSAQYWALAQHGLLAIATSPRFWARPEYGRWAKALFDRGLMLYSALADLTGGPIAPRRLFGVRARLEDYDNFTSRMLANAARAVALGLGSLPAEDPPPLYAYDPDTGRLAVTTPRYSTAIVPDNRGVFDYGGLDPARLFGDGQRVAANVGGTPPGAFGVVVWMDGRRVLASQGTSDGELTVVRSPAGAIRRPRSQPRTPYAGPFRVVEARGRVARGGVRIRVSHRFTADAIESRWRVRCARSCRVRAHFPTWGGGARIPALGRRSLARVRTLDLGGYRVRILGRPRGRLSVLRGRPEPTNPMPGPTVALTVPGRELAVRIVP